MAGSRDVAETLAEVVAGNREAAAALLPLVYTDLRRAARRLIERLPPGQTLEPTGLVHEAYLRLVGSDDPGWEGRAHFYGAAARSMKNILVDLARKKSSAKHGGTWLRVALAGDVPQPELDPEELLAVDRALGKLEAESPRRAEVVLLRAFAGLSMREIARALGVSLATVERDWQYARHWLAAEVESNP